MNTTIHRLQPGDLIELEGESYRVAFVNECRAYCVPVASKTVCYTTRFGKQVQFTAKRPGISIAPTAQVPLLERMPA